MAKYTVEVSTILTSTLGLLDTYSKMPLTKQKHYRLVSESLNPNPVELIETFGISSFDYYFPNVATSPIMTKTDIWGLYSADFKKQFWYEFWSKEIAQENPYDWQRLMYGRLKKSLPLLMIEIEQLLTKDQAFVTGTSQSNQKQETSADQKAKNNSVAHGNTNNIDATATNPQTELDFKLGLKRQYSLGNSSDIQPDTEVDTVTKLDESQPIDAYDFNYADSVDGGIHNTNDTSAGFNHQETETSVNTDDTAQSRTKDIFELIEEMDKLVDGVFLNYFEKLKADSLFIGITN